MDKKIAEKDGPVYPVVRHALNFARLAGQWGIGIGVFSLLGRCLNLPAFTSFGLEQASMKPNTAVGFLCCGGALVLLCPEKPPGRSQRRAGQFLATVAGLLGLATLLEYLTGTDLGIDRLLFARAVVAEGGIYPGRMSSGSAFGFLLLGGALLLLDCQSRRGRRPAQALALGVALVGFIAIIGYVYDESALHSFFAYSSMALPTAVSCVVLGLGVLLSRPERGFVAVFTSRQLGGKMARRLLTIAIPLIVAIGFLRLEGEQAGLYGKEFGVALYALSSIGVLCVLVWDIARSLNLTGGERDQAEALGACQTKVLELIATGTPLTETLDTMLRLMEQFAPGMVCSVLLLDADGQHVRHAAAPSLPEEFNRAIDGEAVGPSAGSCGTAVYRREPVVVEDIATDPLWANYREFALSHGLRACWSTPIFDDQQTVLGTFAIYYREPGLPTERHQRCIELATSLAAIAIGRENTIAALRLSQSRHRRLIESNIIGVMIANTDGRITESNDLFLRTVGFSREDLEAGRVRWDTMTPPEWRAVDDHILRELQATGTCAPVEKEYIRKDGTRVSILASVALLEGTPGTCICLIENLTERKQAEQERQKFALLAESSSEFIGMCDLDLKPLYVNPAGIRMVGLPDMAAACRVNVQEYFFPEDQTYIAEEFFPRVLREGHGEVDIRLRHFQTGEAIWMSYYLFHVRDARGAVVGWATVSRDITERKAAEQKLADSGEQLHALLARLQQTREDERTRIARDVHDVLGQLLTGLKMDVASAQRQIAHVSDDLLRARTEDKLVSAIELTDELIEAVQRISADLRPGILDNIGLAAAVRFESARFQERAGLVVKVSPMPDDLGADAAQSTAVFRILQEIFTNIARHAQASTVDVCLQAVAGCLTLTVHDDGRGLAAETVAAPQSLGLLGMRERARSLGGEVSIESAPGQGTTVRLTLPVGVPDEEVSLPLVDYCPGNSDVAL